MYRPASERLAWFVMWACVWVSALIGLMCIGLLGFTMYVAFSQFVI